MKDKPAVREARYFMKDHPEIGVIELLQPDMNGILRGKRIGTDDLDKACDPGINMCAATTMLDVKGQTNMNVIYGSQDGDPDVYAPIVPGTLTPVPWSGRPIGQALMSLRSPDGAPYFADPRVVLERAAQPLKDMGLKIVAAIELEFYLLDANAHQTPRLKLPRIPGTLLQQDGPQFGMFEDLYEYDDFLSDVMSACETQRIPASTALSEYSPGQFEINLHHVDDPVLACDHGVLLKRLIKGVAREHNLGASFMAKVSADNAGSGLHIHVSLYDDKGRNIFAGAGETQPDFSDSLRHAVGGLMETMAESMAIFAPNGNSYRRFRSGSYVPLTPNWGFNHRALALRIPLSEPENTRIEHRVAGADANPYLAAAAVLAGIHHGLTAQCDPGPMIAEMTVVKNKEATLPIQWLSALDVFDGATVLPPYLGKEYCRVFSGCRRAEAELFLSEVSNRDYEWYLRAI